MVTIKHHLFAAIKKMVKQLIFVVDHSQQKIANYFNNNIK
jgi:hypothetical protein